MMDKHTYALEHFCKYKMSQTNPEKTRHMLFNVFNVCRQIHRLFKHPLTNFKNIMHYTLPAIYSTLSYLLIHYNPI